MSEFDAVVVGGGPNGLAAAAYLARAGRQVAVFEQADQVGGGTRTEELTLPGYLHDVCSAIHPLGIASPFFNDLELEIEWIQPAIPVSHPLPGGQPAGLSRDLAESAERFGSDADHYHRLVGSLVDHAEEVVEDFLAPMRLIPRNPGSFARLAGRGALPATTIINGFTTDEARAVLGGMAAHAIAPFSSPLTGGVTLLFAMTAHAYGWPMIKGGSQRLAEALTEIVLAAGGRIEVGQRISSVDELPSFDYLLLDVMPEAAVEICGDRISPKQRRKSSSRRTGPAVFKIDWALSNPIPWSDELSPLAGTVHLGGTFEEVMAAEDQVHSGSHPSRPFVLLAQQSLFDETRAPDGNHTAWAYCHVPTGSDVDMTDAIEAQVERFAPGFNDLIIGKHVLSPSALESHNPNYVGGDIAGGGFGLRKVLQFGSTSPYKLGEGIFLCSSATPPGAGVHGMCGYYAAKAAIG